MAAVAAPAGTIGRQTTLRDMAPVAPQYVLQARHGATSHPAGVGALGAPALHAGTATRGGGSSDCSWRCAPQSPGSTAKSVQPGPDHPSWHTQPPSTPQTPRPLHMTSAQRPADGATTGRVQSAPPQPGSQAHSPPPDTLQVPWPPHVLPVDTAPVRGSRLEPGQGAQKSAAAKAPVVSLQRRVYEGHEFVEPASRGRQVPPSPGSWLRQAPRHATHALALKNPATHSLHAAPL